MFGSFFSCPVKNISLVSPLLISTFSKEKYDKRGILTKNSDRTVSPCTIYVHLNIDGTGYFYIAFNNVTNFINEFFRTAF